LLPSSVREYPIEGFSPSCAAALAHFSEREKEDGEVARQPPQPTLAGLHAARHLQRSMQSEEAFSAAEKDLFASHASHREAEERRRRQRELDRVQVRAPDSEIDSQANDKSAPPRSPAAKAMAQTQGAQQPPSQSASMRSWYLRWSAESEKTSVEARREVFEGSISSREPAGIVHIRQQALERTSTSGSAAAPVACTTVVSASAVKPQASQAAGTASCSNAELPGLGSVQGAKAAIGLPRYPVPARRESREGRSGTGKVAAKAPSGAVAIVQRADSDMRRSRHMGVDTDLD